MAKAAGAPSVRRRLRMRWVALAGLALMLSSLVYDMVFAGLPYQDPSPELYARFQAHKAIAFRLFFGGAVLLSIGVAFGLLRRAWRRFAS